MNAAVAMWAAEARAAQKRMVAMELVDRAPPTTCVESGSVSRSRIEAMRGWSAFTVKQFRAKSQTSIQTARYDLSRGVLFGMLEIVEGTNPRQYRWRDE